MSLLDEKMEQNPMLVVRGLLKRYPGATVDAVSEVSFSIPKGSICGFIGPNGAGKTTTMRICSTLELPDQGDAFVDGYSVLSYPDEVRKRIGFMPDAFPIDPSVPVADMLEFFGRAHGLWGDDLRSMTESVVEFTNLSAMLDKPFGSLSKGMKQRAALGTILMHDPQLLILDEPAAGLDPRARVELRTLLTMLAEQGKTILISSHILAELTEICTHAIVIEQGKLKATRTLVETAQGREVAVGEDESKEAEHASGKGALRTLYLETLTHPEMVMTFLNDLEMVEFCSLQKKGIAVQIRGDLQIQASLLKVLVEQGLEPVQLVEQKMDLEDLFLSITEGKVQ